MRAIKKLLIGLGVFVVVLALLLIFAEALLHNSGTQKLNEATAELDAAEPGWRLGDLEKARAAAAPPTEANSAQVVAELAKQIPAWWNAHRMQEAATLGHPKNRTPGFSTLLWMIPPAEPTRNLCTTARECLLHPAVLRARGGYTPIQIPDNPLAALLPHAQNMRDVAGILEYSSHLAALQGRTDDALRDSRVILVAARSIGDEPFLISQLIRTAVTKIAINTAYQALGWGQGKDQLANLQAEFFAEAEHNGLLVGLRGERAVIDKLFESIATGKVKLNELGGDTDAGGKLGGMVGSQLYRGLLPGDRAKSLELLTQAVEGAKKPPRERLAALGELKAPPGPPEEFRYLISRLIVPSWVRVAESSVRIRADLLCAATALACERHRIATGAWPESLEAISKDILPVVPVDPFTGRPLKYARQPDGIVVYCEWKDENPQRRIQRQQEHDPLADLGLGIKLWNPDQRGLRPDR